MPLIEDDDVVQALAADRADDAVHGEFQNAAEISAIRHSHAGQVRLFPQLAPANRENSRRLISLFSNSPCTESCGFDSRLGTN